MIKHISGLSTGQKILVAAIIFLVAQGFVWGFSEPGAHLMPDSNEYITAAAEVSRGELGPEVSTVEVLFGARRQPGYILLLAIGETLFGTPVSFVLSLQIMVLLVMGLVTASLSEALLPGSRVLAFVLMVFNPNSFALVQIVLPATVFSLCILLTLWAIWRASASGNWRYGALAGLFLASAYLFRTDAKYLALILPVWVPLLGVVYKAGHSPWRLFLVGAMAATIFLGINLAWTKSKGTFLTAREETVVNSIPHFLVGNIIFLEKRQQPDLSIGEAGAVVADRIINRIKEDGMTGGSHEQGTGFYLSMIGEYPVPTLVQAIISSQVNLFFSGGTQNLARLTNIELPSSHGMFENAEQGDRVSAWWRSIQLAPPGGVFLSILAIGFAVVMRLLAVLGVAFALARRRWGILVFSLPVIGYWAAILLFNGISRYRASIEPVLTLMAIFGVCQLLRMYRTSAKKK
jgi:hypothetical protein